MTSGKNCGCIIDDTGEIAYECEVHQALFKSLIEDRALLEYIKVYAKNDHPMLSSRMCPLCQWEKEKTEDGMWIGKHRTPCSYHYALHQLYNLKIEGQEDIWGNEN